MLFSKSFAPFHWLTKDPDWPEGLDLAFYEARDRYLHDTDHR